MVRLIESPSQSPAQREENGEWAPVICYDDSCIYFDRRFQWRLWLKFEGDEDWTAVGFDNLCPELATVLSDLVVARTPVWFLG